MEKAKRKVKASLNNYTRQNHKRQNHKVKHYYNKTNYFMESGDSCNRLRRSFPSHLGPYHQSDDAFGKKF